ncbi:MAG: Mur ligase family protein [Patescibacteria group bacterium]
MINYLIILIIFPLSAIRILRWVSILQQKEYRFDRLWLFLKTKEGNKELLKVLPRIDEITRVGLKRPVKTSRSIFLSALAFMTSTIFYLLVGNHDYGWVLSMLFYLFLPILIVVINAPSEIIKFLLIQRSIAEAKSILKVGKPLIIGITGSYGKTTSKLLLTHVLSNKYSVFCTPKSYNTKYSLPQSIINHYRNQEVAILEYAAYTLGEIEFLAKHFPPQMVAITGFTVQHLGLFGSEKNIINAKAELVLALPKDGKLFCNAANPGVVKICQAGGRHDFIAYTGERAAVFFEDVKLINGRLQFRWNGSQIKTNLIGLHYLDAVKLSIAVAESLGLSQKEIVSALESFLPDSSFVRLQLMKGGALVIDDGFSSNPVGFKAALELLRSFANSGKRLYLLTGGIVDLGERSSAIHSELAKQASEFVDRVFYTGSVGKEEFQSILAEKLVTDPVQIDQEIDLLSNNQVILLEGRVTKSLEKKLGR